MVSALSLDCSSVMPGDKIRSRIDQFGQRATPDLLPQPSITNKFLLTFTSRGAQRSKARGNPDARGSHELRGTCVRVFRSRIAELFC